MVNGENVLPLKTLSPPSLGLLKFLAKLVVLGFCARSRSMILPGWKSRKAFRNILRS